MGNFNMFFLPIFALFFWGFYYNFFNFYWAAIGDEEVEIKDNSIKITKRVKIFKHSSRYKKDKISNVELVDTSGSYGATGTAMFGFSDVHVYFKYGRKKKMIGKQIETEEGEIIIEELRRWGYDIQQAK
ncbi:hypothetical protein [Reichenbachiella ulvae]|uniref:PH domain-containing protein n=1 Tax=Reichenbachiella ulvae TaxID=2980104 RepID=A0ABT3CQN7_9BACT|nr:hypothetical protein [Reichenbachiella ulvae]MCV9386016.1 hypothetical protein [Reichenbachiella ulvae]